MMRIYLMILFAGALVTACAGGGDVPGADALSVRGEAHVYQKLAQATALSVRGAGMSSDKVLSCEGSEAYREYMRIIGKYIPSYMEWKEVSVKEYRAVYDEAWGR